MKVFALASVMAVAALAQVGPGPDDFTNSDPDAKLNFEQICAENGFAYETHEVTTEDGYILNVFRIPGMLNEEPRNVSKPPVLF